MCDKFQIQDTLITEALIGSYELLSALYLLVIEQTPMRVFRFLLGHHSAIDLR